MPAAARPRDPEVLHRAAWYLAGADLSPDAKRDGRALHDELSTYDPAIGTFDITELLIELRSAGGDCAAVADLQQIEHELLVLSPLLGQAVAVLQGGEPHYDWGRAAVTVVRRRRFGRRGDLQLWADALAEVCDTLSAAFTAFTPGLTDAAALHALSHDAAEMYAARADALRAGRPSGGAFLPDELH